MTTVVAVIQARMGSTRLPGKVLRHLGERPVLQWVVDAATSATSTDEVIVATTESIEDDAVELLAREAGVRCHRGPTDDVLSRFMGATQSTGADAVIRLTGDCPLLDPTLIDAAARVWESTRADYVSTVLDRSLPRGLDVEVVSMEALSTLDAIATGVDRVHVTSRIHGSPLDMTMVSVSVRPRSDDLRVTLDTPEDAQLLDRIVADLGTAGSRWKCLVAYLRSHPEVARLNQDVRQKAIAEG